MGSRYGVRSSPDQSGDQRKRADGRERQQSSKRWELTNYSVREEEGHEKAMHSRPWMEMGSLAALDGRWIIGGHSSALRRIS